MGVGASTREIDAQNDEALWAACAYGDEEALATLIAEAANVNHINKDEGGSTPILAAVQEGSVGILRQLLAHPAIEVHRADAAGMTPCHMACWWDRAECLQMLLEAGADPCRRTKGGFSAAHVAAERDNVECLRVLLEWETPSFWDGDGVTVRDAAVAAGSEACIGLLDEWTPRERPQREVESVV